jgi:hypothetical protein
LIPSSPHEREVAGEVESKALELVFTIRRRTSREQVAGEVANKAFGARA